MATFSFAEQREERSGRRIKVPDEQKIGTVIPIEGAQRQTTSRVGPESAESQT